MIEVGTVDTGSMDLAAKKTASGIRVIDGSLCGGSPERPETNVQLQMLPNHELVSPATV